jgi:uncharacterized protein YqgV (UPF0045/DUF77 family)
MKNETNKNPDVYLAFQVIPRGIRKKAFELVDIATDVVKKSGIEFQIGHMETTMKGELNLLLEIVKEAQQACLDSGATEVITNIKIHSSVNGFDRENDLFCVYHQLAE